MKVKYQGSEIETDAVSVTAFLSSQGVKAEAGRA